jgi:hypothetical protein
MFKGLVKAARKEEKSFLFERQCALRKACLTSMQRKVFEWDLA